VILFSRINHRIIRLKAVDAHNVARVALAAARQVVQAVVKPVAIRDVSFAAACD
jgi:hypothetical protein